MLANLLPSKNRPATFQYTVEVDAPAVAGEGKPRKYHKYAKEELASVPSNANTLHENLLAGAKQSGDRPFLGRRVVKDGVVGAFEFETYNRVVTRVANVGAGLLHRGIKKDAMIGLFSINVPEWVIAEHACYMYGLVTVPLYDTLGAEAIEYIVSSTETTLVFCTADKAPILIATASKIPSLKTIVLMTPGNSDLTTTAAAAGIVVIAMADLEKEGADHAVPKEASVNGETIATICYTSGTTGLPKGVLLTHKNILSFVATSEKYGMTGDIPALTCFDSYLSYLPLAHIFERIIQAAVTNVGARIGFYQGDTLKLLDDVAELKPTVFASVPRLYNRIFDKIRAGVAAKGGLAAVLFEKGFRSKQEYLHRGYTKHSVWDKLIFSKVKARLGGNVRLMFSGAAPISAEVVEFMRICFGAVFLEGYGQSETTGGAVTAVMEDLSTGNVGVPMPSCIVKLRDVPSMNYTSQDKPFPRGEILIKGPNCFAGYYKAPEKTAETLVDGWVLTGDVGMWDTQGHLKIIDRVKNIFKLAQGEYIAPEKIEVVLNKHSLVLQTFVYGDSLQSTLIAVVVPDWETCKPWAEKNGVAADSFAAFCKHPEAKKHILKELEVHGKADGLKGFENVKNLLLISDPFTPENNLLSPTFKLKVHIIDLAP